MIKILKVIETNDFYDSRKVNNGGGYSQPFIEFIYRGTKGTLHDTSCGEFGKRFSLNWDNQEYEFDNISRGVVEYNTFENNKDLDFLIENLGL